MTTLKTRPVQGSEWMVTIREYEIEISAQAFALGSMYGTCGNWGQDAYLSDVAIGKMFGVRRQTVAEWRKGLLAKGLIEDMGPLPWNPKQHRYRTTLPVDLPKPRRDEARGDGPETEHGDGPETEHPMFAERTITTRRELETHLDLDPGGQGEDLDLSAEDKRNIAESIGHSSGASPRASKDSLAPRGSGRTKARGEGKVPGYREVVNSLFSEYVESEVYLSADSLAVLQEAYPDPEKVPVEYICAGSLSYKQYNAYISENKSYGDLGIKSIGALVNWHIVNDELKALEAKGWGHIGSPSSQGDDGQSSRPEYLTGPDFGWEAI